MKFFDTKLGNGLVILSILALVAVLLCGGCATVPHGTTPPPSPSNPFAALKAALAEIDALNTLIYGLSIALIGVGVILMFYLKTSLGPALMAGGGVTLALSLFIKSLLWFVPWIAGGLLLVGSIAFAIDVKKRGFKNALLDVQQILHLPVNTTEKGS